MSIGAPSSLGTLLIQRLDAVLGTTLGQQANLVNGAGPLAIQQPGDPENPTGLQNPAQRDTREAVDQAASQGEQRAAVGKATREMQLDNLLGRSTTLLSATQSAPTTLGYAARIILALLNAYPEADQTIRPQTPLVPNPAGNTASGGAAGQGTSPGNAAQTATTGQAGGAAPTWGQLATALNEPGALAARLAETLTQSVQNSGLFYESHLAQLAGGKSSAQTLRQEPQGRIPIQPPDAATAQSRETPPAVQGRMAQLVQAQASADGTTTPLLSHTDAASSSSASQGQAGMPPATHTPVPGVDPQAQALVRQQLEVLANQGFAWQGEAWPGAPLNWTVQRRDARDSGPRDFDDTHWATQLSLHLPSLGEVQARLSLSGDQLVMRLTAPQSAQRLDGAIEALRSRLLARGLRASQLSVQQSDTETADPGGSLHEIAAS